MILSQNFRVPLDVKSRTTYAKMVTLLFEHWKLSTTDQLMLLGLRSRTTLSQYRNGSPMANKRDLIERVSYLLGIHAQLRLIFPMNENIAYGWMTANISDFYGQTPVDIVRQRGIVGLNMLHVYLLNISDT